MPDTEIFGETEFSFSTLTERFREMAFLTKGIWIHFADERPVKRGQGAGCGRRRTARRRCTKSLREELADDTDDAGGG